MKVKYWKLVRDVVTPAFREHTESITNLEAGMRMKAEWLARDRWRNDKQCDIQSKKKVYRLKSSGWYSKVHLIPLM